MPRVARLVEPLSAISMHLFRSPAPRTEQVGIAARTAGSYRVGLTVVGVVMVVITGAAAQSLADMSRLVARGGNVAAARVRLTRRLAAIAVLSTAVLLVLPAAAGRLVFGDAWADARPVAVVLAISSIASAIVTPALSSIRAHGAADAVLRLRMRLSPVQLVLVAGGAQIDGARGAALGLLLGNSVSILPWLRLAARHERRDETASSVAPEATHEDSDPTVTIASPAQAADASTPDARSESTARQPERPPARA